MRLCLLVTDAHAYGGQRYKLSGTVVCEHLWDFCYQQSHTTNFSNLHWTGEPPHPQHILLLLFLNIFIYLFLAALGVCCCAWAFLDLWPAGATLRCGARASHCSGFSCCRAWALDTWASVVVACRLSSCSSQALECRLSSCGAQA